MPVEIDTKLLPRSAAIDTGVFLRGLLGAYPNHPDTEACVAFCKAMVTGGRTLYVAAPTIAEVSRFQGARVPHVRGVVIVAFDGAAAEELGLNMPMEKLHQASAASGMTMTYLKYDAMIFACAIRSRAPMLVAIDGDHEKIAQHLSFPVRRPGSFAKPSQASLFDLFGSAANDAPPPTTIAPATTTTTLPSAAASETQTNSPAPQERPGQEPPADAAKSADAEPAAVEPAEIPAPSPAPESLLPGPVPEPSPPAESSSTARGCADATGD